MSGDDPPFTVTTDYGDLSGFEETVARHFAQDRKRDLTFVSLRWPQLIEDAKARRFDVAMSGVTMQAERALFMLFSRPYAITATVVLIRRDRLREIGSLEAVDREDVRLAIHRDGNLESVTKRRFPRANIVTVDTHQMLIDLVLSGGADGAVVRDYDAAGWSQDLTTLPPFRRERKAYAVVPERPDLLAELNKWLAAREADGWLNAERRRWLGAGAEWTREQACFEAIVAAIDMRLQLTEWLVAADGDGAAANESSATGQDSSDQANLWAESAELEPQEVEDLLARLVAVEDKLRHTAAADSEPPASVELVRRAIAAEDRALVEEVGRCQEVLSRSDWHPWLVEALNDGLTSRAAALLPAEELADLLSRVRSAAPRAASAGAFVEFCIPSQWHFDRQGYVAEELVDGAPRRFSLLERLKGAGPSTLRPGRTRTPVKPGRHEFYVYVQRSSGDPHLVGGPATTPTRVVVDVPHNQVVTVGFKPIAHPAGQFELRWDHVFGGGFGLLVHYRGVTRFDVETTIYQPTAPGAASPCPFNSP